MEREDYWSASRRPLCALVFLLPLLAAYEFGVLFLDLDSGIREVRNGADSWMRGWLLAAGLEHVWLLPALMICGRPSTSMSWAVEKENVCRASVWRATRQRTSPVCRSKQPMKS